MYCYVSNLLSIVWFPRDSYFGSFYMVISPYKPDMERELWFSDLDWCPKNRTYLFFNRQQSVNFCPQRRILLVQLQIFFITKDFE